MKDRTKIIAQAADLAGMTPDDWLASAIDNASAAEHRKKQRLDAREDGPWPGWYSIRRLEYGAIYHGPNGEEIWFMPRGADVSDYRNSGTRRPWSANTADGCLTNRAGRIRTFASADAAKRALEAV